MKTPRIAEAMGHIEDDLIADAELGKKNRRRIKWGWLAACVGLLGIVAVALVLRPFRKGDPAQGKYIYQITGTEAAIEWPWEYKTNAEKYRTLTFEGSAYVIKSFDAIPTEALGTLLGECQAEGMDIYTNKTYAETLEVYEINGVSADRLIAAGRGEVYYVYALEDASKPSTLGALMDLYGLSNTLPLIKYSVCEGYDENGYFSISDDSYIWEVLGNCEQAPVCTDSESFDRSNRSYLSFTATSPALGVYKRVVYISEDGYFATNIFDYSYVYHIGAEAAGKIISYAESNSVKAQREPYEQTIGGTILEIHDDYFLLDDSVLCADEADGTIYKVYTDDIRIRRSIECAGIKVGDTVAVKYRGEISQSSEIRSAYAMFKGVITSNDVAVPE